MRAHRSFNRIWKERDSAQPELLEKILDKDNFNRAFKRVKANKGAPGIDGMTIGEALPYLREHQKEITDRIYRGKYTPSPVRRVEIPKPDGGVPFDLAYQTGNTRRGYWFTTHTVAVNMALTKERLVRSGFYDLSVAYQSVHVNY